MNFFQRCVKKSVQEFNVLGLYQTLPDLYSQRNFSSMLKSIAHSAALLSSLVDYKPVLHGLSVLTNGLYLSYISYQAITDEFTLSLSIESLEVFIHLVNLIMELTEANRETENNGIVASH
jgi:hypothetical protein